jgi:hypothetical protein
VSAARSEHEHFDELAVGFSLHALEPEDEAVFARHLPECPRCARTVAETREVMAAMAADLAPAEPSEGLRDRLRSAVEHTDQVPRPVAPEQAPRAHPVEGRHRDDDTDPGFRLPRPVPPSRADDPTTTGGSRQRAVVLALAAAVAGVVGLGVWNVTLSSDRDRAVEVATEQGDIVEELLRPGARVVAQLSDTDGRPLATVVTQDDRLQVVSQGLRVNDTNAETYVLWGVGEGPEVPLGTFDVDRSGLDVDAVMSPPTGAGSFAQYAISLEPGRLPPPAPSGVLAIGQVTS